MKQVRIIANCRKLPADTVTPVGIYLRLRDRFPGCLLLESVDPILIGSHAGQNSWSFICVKPVAGIRVEKNADGAAMVRVHYPGREESIEPVRSGQTPERMNDFLRSFSIEGEMPVKGTAGLFGYTSYDAVQLFETIQFRDRAAADIPLIRYELFGYVIAIDHFKDQLFLCENLVEGMESESDHIESLIRNTNVPAFPFSAAGDESGNFTDEAFMQAVESGKAHCRRGDVFQVVLSRRFEKAFTGDEFNVYRALRSINPSPYLFYFDYGDYRLFGSSPEAQLVIAGGKATIHPIAGTFRRTGDDAEDRVLAGKLLNDPKENAEHVMLVDLARNDLSRHAKNVQVESFREVHYYSHVIHLVSKVGGDLRANANPFRLQADTFPAGTLCGAPKFKAMELIDRYENAARGFYGGCIGFAGFNGDLNQAIMIRTFLSRSNKLIFQAGAGVVAHSDAASELQEVSNKLNALRAAITAAAEMTRTPKTELYASSTR